MQGEVWGERKEVKIEGKKHLGQQDARREEKVNRRKNNSKVKKHLEWQDARRVQQVSRELT